jgi:quercetin dioxygenase-like cupin family protein
MRYTLITAALIAVAAGTAQGQAGASTKHATAKPASSMAKAAPGEDFKWGPAPAIFPTGAQMAVLQGNPGGTEMFTVRLRFPNGYKIAPHTHPTDEHVTVISGHFKVGMGDTANAKSMMTLKPGAFVTAPANKSHYASAVGPTVVQVSAMGPFAMTYVNPADTPAGARK